MAAVRKRAERPAAGRVQAAGPVCNVWQVWPRSECTITPAKAFTARCGCGHPIEGNACEGCLDSPKLGCLRCWRLPADRRHKCQVTVVVPA